MQKYMSKANRLLYVTLILLLTVSDEGVLQETSDNGFWKGIRWRDPKGKIFNVAAGMLYFYFLIPKHTVIECFFLFYKHFRMYTSETSAELGKQEFRSDSNWNVKRISGVSARELLWKPI